MEKQKIFHCQRYKRREDFIRKLYIYSRLHMHISAHVGDIFCCKITLILWVKLLKRVFLAVALEFRQSVTK